MPRQASAAQLEAADLEELCRALATPACAPTSAAPPSVPVGEAVRLAPGASSPQRLAAALQCLGLDTAQEDGKLRLRRHLRLLDRQRLERALAPAMAPGDADLQTCFSTGSTNTDVAAWLAAPPAGRRGALRLAEHQSGGRGRRGRTWNSPLAAHVYLSLGYLLPAAEPLAPGLSLAAGVVVARTLRERGVPDIGLKWPNDIYRRGCKLGGVLVEASTDADYHRVVVGVGVNCAMPPGFAPDTPWSDLSDLRLDRSELAGGLGAGLLALLRDWKQPGFAAWQREWNDLHEHRGVQVRVEQGQGRQLRGVATGVDAQGALLLRTESGVETVNAGEVSLRPEDGPPAD